MEDLRINSHIQFISLNVDGASLPYANGFMSHPLKKCQVSNCSVLTFELNFDFGDSV